MLRFDVFEVRRQYFMMMLLLANAHTRVCVVGVQLRFILVKAISAVVVRLRLWPNC